MIQSKERMIIFTFIDEDSSLCRKYRPLKISDTYISRTKVFGRFDFGQMFVRKFLVINVTQSIDMMSSPKLANLLFFVELTW